MNEPRPATPIESPDIAGAPGEPEGPCQRPAGLRCPCTEGGPCLCAASGGRARPSVIKCAMALALVGVVGSFAMLKPDPEGVRASDLSWTPASEARLQELRAHVLREHPVDEGAGALSAPGSGTEWRAVGSLVGSDVTVLIEAQDTSFVYTVKDPEGRVLATRLTREELQSLLPHLDVDSLTASPEHPRLMLADDPGDH